MLRLTETRGVRRCPDSFHVAQLLGGDGKLYGLEQRVRRGPDHGTVRVTPMAERQEPDLLHRQISIRT